MDLTPSRLLRVVTW